MTDTTLMALEELKVDAHRARSQAHLSVDPPMLCMDAEVAELLIGLAQNNLIIHNAGLHAVERSTARHAESHFRNRIERLFRTEANDDDGGGDAEPTS